MGESNVDRVRAVANSCGERCHEGLSSGVQIAA